MLHVLRANANDSAEPKFRLQSATLVSSHHLQESLLRRNQPFAVAQCLQRLLEILPLQAENKGKTIRDQHFLSVAISFCYNLLDHPFIFKV